MERLFSGLSLCFILVFSVVFLVANRKSERLDVNQIFQNSSGSFAGDVFLLPERGNFLLDEDDLTDSSHHHMSHVREGGRIRVLPPHPLTTHGFAWDYDLNIPLVIADPSGKYIQRGVFSKLAVQQDIAPTIAELLMTSAPERSSGRVLEETLVRSNKTRPKVIVVFALDQVGENYLERHNEKFSFLNTLAKQYARFSQMQVAHIDVETSVGHVALGTGAYPPETGIGSNGFFNPGLQQVSSVFSMKVGPQYQSKAFPHLFFAPTIGDQWMRETKGKAVNFSLSSAARASVGMAGHGKAFKGGYASHVMYFATSGENIGRFTTDENFYTLPEIAKSRNLKTYAADFSRRHHGKWFENPLVKPNGDFDYELIMATPAMVEMETDIILDSMAELQVGRDDTTDLVWINIKSTDYCGHKFGFESEECGVTSKAADEEMEKVFNYIKSASDNDFVMFVTADHGVAPLPELSGAMRLGREKLIGDINRRFSLKSSPSDRGVVLQLTSSQLYLDKPLLASRGYQVRDVVQFLKDYQVDLSAPGNMLADEWIKKGKPRRSKFFRDVQVRPSSF